MCHTAALAALPSASSMATISWLGGQQVHIASRLRCAAACLMHPLLTRLAVPESHQMSVQCPAETHIASTDGNILSCAGAA